MQAFNDLAMGKNPPSASTTLSDSAAKKDYEKNWKSRMPQLKSGVWMIPTTQTHQALSPSNAQSPLIKEKMQRRG